MYLVSNVGYLHEKNTNIDMGGVQSVGEDAKFMRVGVYYEHMKAALFEVSTTCWEN